MVRLRELERRDIPEINQWRNDPELMRMLGNNFRYIAQEIDYDWYDSYQRDRDQAVRLALVDEGDRIIGCVNLTGIHSINRSAEYSILIGPGTERRKGYGMYATQEILRHAFENLNLNRVYLYVLSRNKPAIKLYERIGFQKEGILRDAIFKNGKFEDEIMMSILRREYDSRNPFPS